MIFEENPCVENGVEQTVPLFSSESKREMEKITNNISNGSINRVCYSARRGGVRRRFCDYGESHCQQPNPSLTTISKNVKTEARGRIILDRKTAGKMLFALVLMLCFCGNVATSAGYFTSKAYLLDNNPIFKQQRENNPHSGSKSFHSRHLDSNILGSDNWEDAAPIQSENNHFYRNSRMKSSNYSSHHCVGGNGLNDAEFSAERSCVFFNVCHKKSGPPGVLYYYVDPERPRPPLYNKEYSFWYDFGPAVYKGNYPYRDSPQKWETPGRWGPTIVEGKRPDYPVSAIKQNILFEPFHEEGVAEFMHLLLAFFTLPLMHGYTPKTDMALIEFGDPKDISKLHSKLVLKHRKHLLAGMTKHEPVFLDSMGDVCYDTVFVGAGMLTVLHNNPTLQITGDRMRDYILGNIGYDPPPLATNNRHRILIMLKSINGCSNPENHIMNSDALLEYLQTKLAAVADVESMIPDSFTWKEQIDKMQSATVIITAAGGGSFGAFFTRPGTSIIFLDRLYRKGSYRHISGIQGMEDAFWSRLKDISRFNYPMCSQVESAGPEGQDILIVLPRMLHYSIIGMLAAEDRYEHLQNEQTLKDMSKKSNGGLGVTPNLCTASPFEQERDNPKEKQQYYAKCTH